MHNLPYSSAECCQELSEQVLPTEHYASISSVFEFKLLAPDQPPCLVLREQDVVCVFLLDTDLSRAEWRAESMLEAGSCVFQL